MDGYGGASNDVKIAVDWPFSFRRLDRMLQSNFDEIDHGLGAKA
jgi:hypothetical protein